MTALAFHTVVAKVHAAATAAELAFTLCNETQAIADYRQAALVGFFGARRTRLVAHSGLAEVDSNSPYALWLADVANHIRARLDALPADARVLSVSKSMLPKALAASWNDWLPDHVWALSLAGPDAVVQAVLLLAREAPWPDEFSDDEPEYFLLQAAGAFGHAWWAWNARRRSIGTLLATAWSRRSVRWSLAVVPLLLLVPVKEYALLPAEVVSTRTQVISSPRDGVIRRMVVAPNSPVSAGQPIAELDDSTLFNRMAVARAMLESARIDLHQASQRAIENQAAKSELGLAQGKLREREVDVDSLQREITQLSIKAPAAGVFVYSDPDDWAGRPVQTGERIGLLADPAALGLHAWAPVNEAVNLRPGAPMMLFLRVAPLAPVSGRLEYAGYQVVESPTAVASYLLRGTIDGSSAGDFAQVAQVAQAAEAAPIGMVGRQPPMAHLRIGLRGTARVSGDWVALGYLLFRRPLASVREWCGC